MVREGGVASKMPIAARVPCPVACCVCVCTLVCGVKICARSLCVRVLRVFILFFGIVGAADNTDMLEGVEGQAACTALAKAMSVCMSLQELNLKGRWRGKAWA